MTITNRVTLKSLNAGLTPATDVPDAPTIGTATAGVFSASVAFTAAATGGTPTTYTVTSSPGSLTGTGASSPITVSGLTGGTSYTFTVTATNASGTSPSSSASNSVTPASPLGYESIQTATGTGSSSTITFSSIPQTYQHLQIRYVASASGVDRLFMRFNSDSAQNYSSHNVFGDGANSSTNSSTTSNQIGWAGYIADSSLSSVIMATGIIDILDYTDTNKNKVIRTLNGFDSNGSGKVGLSSGLWMSTAAVTSITLFPQNSPNWTTNTVFYLYGVK